MQGRLRVHRSDHTSIAHASLEIGKEVYIETNYISQLTCIVGITALELLGSKENGKGWKENEW